jgi:hypothetical protein
MDRQQLATEVTIEPAGELLIVSTAGFRTPRPQRREQLVIDLPDKVGKIAVAYADGMEVHARAVVIVVALVGAARGDDSAPSYRATVELADKQGLRHAVVTSKLSCSVPAKCPAWTLDLGTADAADVLTLVDLRGEPTRVRASTTPTLTLPGSAKLPAAVVRTTVTDAGNTRWERWTLVSLEAGRAKAIWRGEIAMRPDKGGGYTTPDGIELVATEAGQPLALELAQLALPNDKARGPVKPVRRRFTMKDGTYQRP